jgi:hypothetical protein
MGMGKRQQLGWGLWVWVKDNSREGSGGWVKAAGKGSGGWVKPANTIQNTDYRKLKYICRSTNAGNYGTIKKFENHRNNPCLFPPIEHP